MPRITKTKEQEKALARTNELLKRLNKINQVFEASSESGGSERNRENAEISVIVSGVKVKIPVAEETALDILSDIRKRYCAEVRNSEKKFNIELDEQDQDIFIGVSKSGKTKRGKTEDTPEEMPEQNTSSIISESMAMLPDSPETDWENDSGGQDFQRENCVDGGEVTETWQREE